jgi:hypothetical protein
MKLPLAAMFAPVIAATMLVATSQATIITVDSNIVSRLNTPNTSPHSWTETFTSGADSIVLQFTVSTQSGESFTSLDGATRVGVGPSGADGNHIDISEDLAVDVDYVSHSGLVDPTSIEFRFDSIGFRNLSGGTSNVSWTVNGGTPTNIATTNGSELARTLDTAFTLIGTSTTAYTGVFENLAGNNSGQLSSLPADTSHAGLRFSVQFSAVPEPSTFTMLLVGGVMLWVVGCTRKPASRRGKK